MSTDSIAPELFITTLAAHGVTLSAQQFTQFAHYADELERWNAHTNLTAVSGRPHIYMRHFLDSLSLAWLWEAPPQRMIDLGTGAGFPGLPLKLLYPTMTLTLADSVGKKTAFLNHMVQSLGLDTVRVRTARAEELGRDPVEREQYDVATARALVELRVLVEYALPLLRVGGLLLAPKGPGALAEADAAAGALTALGGRLEGVLPVDLPGLETRAVVLIRKMHPTSQRYPRAVGIPARRPL